LKELVQLKVSEPGGPDLEQLKKRDDLYESAVEVVVREGRGSVSLLQRALGIGYGRAARLIDYMEEDGFVGPYAGSQAREVLLTADGWAAMQGVEAEEVEAPPRRVNKIVPSDEEQEAVDQAEEDELDEEEVDELDEDEEEEEEEEEEVDELDEDEEDEYEEEEYEEDEYEEDEYEEDDKAESA